MKKTYITPALQETPMDLRSAVAQLTGNTEDDHIGSGGEDHGENEIGSNSRNSWDQFWEDRE